MRVALLTAAVAMLMCATAANASILARRAPHRITSGSGSDQPQPTNHGTGFKLLSEIVAALHYKNFTWASSLLADDGLFIISDVSCDPIPKNELLGLAQADNVTSSQVIFKSWVETDGVTVVSAEVGAMFAAGTPNANQSFYSSTVFYVAVPTLDGSQLLVLERWSDLSYRQYNNASSMMYTFNQLIAAQTVRDLDTFKKLTTSTFDYSLHFPWGQYPENKQNRTGFLEMLAQGFAVTTKSEIKIAAAFPVCQLVLADIMTFQTQTTGNSVNKFFIALALDDSFRATRIEEYMLGLV